MSNTLGDKIKVTIFGQSHSEAIGCVIDGFPAGFKPDMEKVRKFMSRRAPGKGEHTTARKESDAPRVVSGLADGATCGAPICAMIENGDVRSGDYGEIARKPRPGHADYTAFVKYGGSNDVRGGGQFSGRLTAPLCFAGALCMQYLETKGIRIAARASETAGISDAPLDIEKLFAVAEKPFPAIDGGAAEKMLAAIASAKEAGDSVGGVIECVVIGLPAGIGEPMFGGVENEIARAVFGVPAVKGIEFGAGFSAARMKGSENNDPFEYKDGAVVCGTNNAGGILGGITNGMPVVFRCAIKPTPSVALPQKTVDVETGENATLEIKGRHDPCIVPRAVPAIEAAAAIAILNLIP
ncbi:MAG: chorismate synthase [Clostridia bacterium]|nr:chorismate synthase [Clostridia bacterium]